MIATGALEPLMQMGASLGLPRVNGLRSRWSLGLPSADDVSRMSFSVSSTPTYSFPEEYMGITPLLVGFHLSAKDNNIGGYDALIGFRNSKIKDAWNYIMFQLPEQYHETLEKWCCSKACKPSNL